MIPLLISFAIASPPIADRPSVVIAIGAPGVPEYASAFRAAADRWKAAALKGGAEAVIIGEGTASTGPSDHDHLREAISARAVGSKEPLWIVLIGHGTFDGKEAKFNLRGPDVSDAEMANWLKPVQRPLALLNGSSASSPFLSRLSAPGRILVTATRSGSESSYARFGLALAETIADPAADLDKDGQTSLLEAYLAASHRVDEFYRTRSRLATEHPLLDDNGDRLGTPPDWFRGVRATRGARDGAPVDGLRAHQLHLVPSDRERRLPVEVRRHRDELELALAGIRNRKGQMPEDDYYRQLEPILLELGRLYREAESATRKETGEEK